jgi:hypothetical protein
MSHIANDAATVEFIGVPPVLDTTRLYTKALNPVTA